MKIKIVKSVLGFTFNEVGKVINSKNVGKVARVRAYNGDRTLAIILPCGHLCVIDKWNVTDIDTDTPSATPSIFCKGQDDKPCWHGYLTKGELEEV